MSDLCDHGQLLLIATGSLVSWSSTVHWCPDCGTLVVVSHGPGGQTRQHTPSHRKASTTTAAAARKPLCRECHGMRMKMNAGIEVPCERCGGSGAEP